MNQSSRQSIVALSSGNQRCLVAGVTTIDVAVASAAGQAAPEWIKIAHRGELRCRDGRVYTLDPEAIVTRFAADSVDVPIDLDHASVKRAPMGETVPAQGWIKELEARTDGLYGRCEWLDGGKAVLAARTHRYVSPAFQHDDENRATWLHSVALVAAPALGSMPALASAGDHGFMRATEIGEIATALGLDQGASRATCLAAITQLRAEAVPLAVHRQTVAQLAATATELRNVRATVRAENVHAMIEQALKEKKITPAERGKYADLCATDAGLDTVKQLFGIMSVKLEPILEGRRALGGQIIRTPETLAALATKKQQEMAASGQHVSLADAMTMVMSATPV